GPARDDGRRVATCAATWSRPARRPAAIPAGSIEIERLALEVLAALHRDQHREALLLRIAVLLRLHQPPPHLLVDRPGAVDLRGAVEARDAALGQEARLPELRLPEIDGDLGPVGEGGGGRAPAALPGREVLVVEHHRAATLSHLGEPVRSDDGDQADVGGEGGVDVLVERSRDLHAILPEPASGSPRYPTVPFRPRSWPPPSGSRCR